MEVDRNSWISADNTRWTKITDTVWKTNPLIDLKVPECGCDKPEPKRFIAGEILFAIPKETTEPQGPSRWNMPEVKKLPQFLEVILEKKIAKTPLNLLEKIIDWVASFFDSYIQRQQCLCEKSQVSNEIAGRMQSCKTRQLEKAQKAELALQIQQEADAIRASELQKKLQAVSYIDDLIEKHFTDQFSVEERQEIKDKIITPSNPSTATLQRLIDCWWNLALIQECPKTALELFKKLEIHFSANDTDRDRWKKITFIFGERKEDAAEEEEPLEGEEKLTRLEIEYPLYTMHVLCKVSEFFRTFTSFHKDRDWADSPIQLLELSSADFKFIFVNLCGAENLEKCKPISQMGFAEAGDLLEKVSFFQFPQLVKECSRRLSELVAADSLNKETFDNVVEILKAEVGANSSFINTLEVFCSRYLETLNGEELQLALGQLVDVPITTLTMSGKTTDENLDVLGNITHLLSLELTDCVQVTNNGLKHLLKLTQLSSLSIKECRTITYEGIWSLKSLNNLKTLSLDGCPIEGEDFLIYFNEMESLENLSLKRLPQLKEWVSEVGKIPKLKALNLSGCTGIEEESFKLLCTNSTLRLTSLTVSNCINVTNDSISHFKSFPLTDLNLFGCTQLTDEALNHLLEISTLVSLNLPRGSHLTPQGIGKFVADFEAKFQRSLSLAC